MKIKSEVRIGFVVLVTIALVIYGINFLKGRNVLRRTDVFYAVYNDIGGLGLSSSVYINGLKIGLVNDISFREGRLDELVVAFTCDHQYTIPKGTTVELFSESIIGGKALRLIPGTSAEMHRFGDTLASKVSYDLITKLENELDPLQESTLAVFAKIDSLVDKLNHLLGAGMIDDLQQTVSNLNKTSRQLSEARISQTLSELRKFSTTLAENREALASAIQNLNSVTDSLAKADLTRTLQNIDKTFGQTSILIENINEGKGTIGQLAVNDSLYHHLNATSKELQNLLDDLNRNPKRYVHFSLFGRKDKNRD